MSDDASTSSPTGAPATEDIRVQFDASKYHGLSSFKTRVGYLANSGLLLCLPVYIFTETKGLPLWANLQAFSAVYAVAVVAFTVILQGASLAKLKSLAASYPKIKEASSKAREAQRKTTLENMAVLYSIGLLNFLFLFMFVFFSHVFFSPLPKIFNYGLSVSLPIVTLWFLYRP